MWLRRLSLTDFRSYPTAELGIEPGITTFVGPNGHGKTNLLEAVGYLATLGSHRVAADAALIRRGAERAYLRAAVVRDDRELLLEVEVNAGRANRARVNRAPVRPRELLGLLRTVLFAPEDLAVVKGDPAERRRFLDDLLVTRAPRFAGVRADFDRVLRQRNALLKSLAGRRVDAGQLSTLESWDLHLAEGSAELIRARQQLTADLLPWVAESYRAVSGRDTPVGVAYQCSVLAAEEGVATRDELAAAVLARVAELRDAELARGMTLVGPHRDELALEISGLPARGYASHGESWSLALALRLASYRLLADEPGGVPVLLLDDVFAELDSDRRARLADLVVDAEQVLITAAALEDVPAALHGSRFDVQSGAVRHVA